MHDQPIKALGIEAGVNITVGLPVIGTSVDHGTAFDIAGKGPRRRNISMLEALRQAVALAAANLSAFMNAGAGETMGPIPVAAVMYMPWRTWTTWMR